MREVFLCVKMSVELLCLCDFAEEAVQSFVVVCASKRAADLALKMNDWVEKNGLNRGMFVAVP